MWQIEGFYPKNSFAKVVILFSPTSKISSKTKSNKQTMLIATLSIS
jgi:hypothetical protein